jgi:hypothetical protein
MLGSGELFVRDEPILVLVLVGENLLHQLVLQQPRGVKEGVFYIGDQRMLGKIREKNR